MKLNDLECNWAEFSAQYKDPIGRTLISAQPTMTSREIAELTGKEHRHVMRDIREMLDVLKRDEPSFGRYYTAANGKPNPEYVLPKDLTLTLVTGYSAPLRHRIITRWQELESQAAPANLMAEISRRHVLNRHKVLPGYFSALQVAGMS